MKHIDLSNIVHTTYYTWFSFEVQLSFSNLRSLKTVEKAENLRIFLTFSILRHRIYKGFDAMVAKTLNRQTPDSS